MPAAILQSCSTPAEVSQALVQAGAHLRAGRLVAFPTETVYGLGALATAPQAIAEVYRVKGRPSTNPLIVHVADEDQAKILAAAWPDTASRLVKAFWPGALTIVLRKTDAIPLAMTAGGSTVALRCPNHPVALALIRAVGPLAAPSANRSGAVSPTTAQHVQQGLGDDIAMILDGGPCTGGLESTVVDLSGDAPRLLRPGLIALDQIRNVIGPVEVGATDSAAPLHSPGLLTRHYAPRTALECTQTSEEADFLTNLYETAGLKVARYTLNLDVQLASAQLYADLHELDGRGFDRIIAVLPPDTEAWRAIRDRLSRASADE